MTNTLKTLLIASTLTIASLSGAAAESLFDENIDAAFIKIGSSFDHDERLNVERPSFTDEILRSVQQSS